MQKVYTAENMLDVNHCRGLLHSAGIECELRNQILGGAGGGLPLNEVWPEVWVAEADYEAAKRVVHRMTTPAEAVGGAWDCVCGERLEAQFTECWNCGEVRP